MTTRIRCRDHHCIYNKRGICTSNEIEYDPDAGCLTMEPRGVEAPEETKLDEEELEEELEEEFGDEEEEEDEEDWDEDRNDGWGGGAKKAAKRR